MTAPHTFGVGDLDPVSDFHPSSVPRLDRPSLPARLFVVTMFFVLPAIVYAFVITLGNFNPFGQVYGWQAYNQLALALMHGHQAIPADAISGEGLYVDGRVYMYYGLLPALLRIPLSLIVDLDRTPVSNLLVWSEIIVGQFALQSTLLAIFAKTRRTTINWLVLCLASLTMWFCSGQFLIVRNGNLYHEPYAAAVMLSSLFIAMAARDLFIAPRSPSIGRLATYAALAGLCVFARQTYAVGLYFATVTLLLPAWHELRARPLASLRAAAFRAAVPLMVLATAGVAYLAFAYYRTGAIGSGWSVDRYGYFILDNSVERLKTIRDQQFSAVRILPTALYVLVGGPDLRNSIIKALGGGVVLSYMPAVRYINYAPVLLLAALAGAVALLRRWITTASSAPLIIVTLSFALTALLQLSYATMAWRYTAELSPLLIWLALIAMSDFDLDRAPRRALAILCVAGALMLNSGNYYVNMRARFVDDSPVKGPGSLREPLPPELVARATAPGSRSPLIASQLLRQYRNK